MNQKISEDLIDREKLLITPPESDSESQPEPNEGPEQLDCIFTPLLNVNAI